MAEPSPRLSTGITLYQEEHLIIQKIIARGWTLKPPARLNATQAIRMALHTASVDKIPEQAYYEEVSRHPKGGRQKKNTPPAAS